MTLRYPEEKLEIDSGYTFDYKTDTGSPGFKGRHILYTDKCVEGNWPINERSIMPQIDYGRCVFCGFCVDACPFDCLFMTPEYELSVTDKRKLVHTPFQLAVFPEKKGTVKLIPGKRGAHHD